MREYIVHIDVILLTEYLNEKFYTLCPNIIIVDFFFQAKQVCKFRCISNQYSNINNYANQLKFQRNKFWK